MVTRITYEGVDSVVELEDRAVTLSGAAVRSARAVGTDAAGVDADAGDRVVIPRWEVDDVTLEPASLLSYGRLVVTARGRVYTVEFTRDAQERFGDLAIVLR